MHFITGMYSLQLYITTCHARDGVSDTPEHSNHIYLLNSSLIGDTDTVAWLRAARCTATGPHRASQAAISLHGITASNAALPSRKVEGLLGPLRPWSGSRSCGARPRPRPLPFAHASHADARTKTTACARAVRVRCCPRICQATTMRRTAGIKNNIGTRVERREKPSDSLTEVAVSG